MKHIKFEPLFQVVHASRDIELFTRDSLDLLQRFWRVYFKQFYSLEHVVPNKIARSKFTPLIERIDQLQNQQKDRINSSLTPMKVKLQNLNTCLEMEPLVRVTIPVHTTRMKTQVQIFELFDQMLAYFDLFSLSVDEETNGPTRIDIVGMMKTTLKDQMNEQSAMVNEFNRNFRRSKSHLNKRGARYLPNA